MHKEYFYIEPYVYGALYDNKVILYNTLSYKYILKTIEDELTKEFINSLISDEVRTIEIEKKYKDNESLSIFIDECRCLFIGDIHLGAKPFIRPFQSYVNTNIEELKGDFSIRKITPLIKELSIIIGGETNCKNKDLLDRGYKQFLFPINSKETIDFKLLEDSMNKINFNLNSVSIVGNVFRYKEIRDLLGLFNGINKNVYIYYLDIENIDIVVKLLSKNVQIVVLVDNNYDVVLLNRNIHLLKENNLSFEVKYIVETKSDLEYLDSNKLNIEVNENIVPFYNHNNLDFFKENVFIDECDILEEKYKEEEIFTKEHINNNFFGKLFIKANGEIYSNFNSSKIGELGDDWETILGENLLKDSFWFMKRNSKPCSNCLYKLLCPSISNYELVIGKNNLCNVIE